MTTTLNLNPNEKYPNDWLGRMIRNAVPGTLLVYWIGETDVLPTGKRKNIFEFVMAAFESGKVNLKQRKKDDGYYEYIMEVRSS